MAFAIYTPFSPDIAHCYSSGEREAFDYFLIGKKTFSTPALMPLRLHFPAVPILFYGR